LFILVALTTASGAMQSDESASPESSVGVQPLLDLCQRFALKMTDTASSLFFAIDKSGTLKNIKVAGNR